MDNEKNIKKQEEAKSLPVAVGWEIKTARLFRKYLADYEGLPSYKKVLSTMIKFSQMYQPISRYGYPDPFGDVWRENEYRSLKRAQIYMNRRKIIKTYDRTHGKRLVITSQGEKIFYKDYPLARLRAKKWDGFWTLAMYDFPEKIRSQRAFIRRKLLSFGFGSPQISILVTPLPLEEDIQRLIESERMKNYIWVLRAKSILGMENSEIVRRTWPIGELNFLYQKLLEALGVVKGDKELTSQWQVHFLAVNSADPYLPFELLPEGWLGERCEREFVKLSGRFGFLRALFREIGQRV